MAASGAFRRQRCPRPPRLQACLAPAPGCADSAGAAGRPGSLSAPAFDLGQSRGSRSARARGAQGRGEGERGREAAPGPSPTEPEQLCRRFPFVPSSSRARWAGVPGQEMHGDSQAPARAHRGCWELDPPFPVCDPRQGPSTFPNIWHQTGNMFRQPLGNKDTEDREWSPVPTPQSSPGMSVMKATGPLRAAVGPARSRRLCSGQHSRLWKEEYSPSRSFSSSPPTSCDCSLALALGNHPGILPFFPKLPRILRG